MTRKLYTYNLKSFNASRKKRINYFKTDGLITFNWTLKVLSFRAFAPAFVTVFFFLRNIFHIIDIMLYMYALYREIYGWL